MRYVLLAAAALIATLYIPASHAEDGVSPRDRIYLSVGNAGGDRHWNESECATLHNVVTLARGRPAETRCGATDSESSYGLQTERASGRYSYHITAEKRGDGSVSLGIQNWSTNPDQTEFDEVGWVVQPDTEDTQATLVQRRLEKFFEYDRLRRPAKELLLMHGVREASRVQLRDGVYWDSHLGREVDFDQAYGLYRDESTRHKHYLRAGMETLALLGAGMVLYYSNPKANEADFDFNADWTTWRKRLTNFEAVTFDTNYFNVNSVFHPAAGTFYYLFARTNNLNPLESFLFATAASTLWEYVGEMKEKVSINDLIVTPVAGMAIGEAFAQLGAFFDRGSDNFVNRALSAIFTGPRSLHNWIDKNKPKRTDNVDALGFTRDIWHEFSLTAAGGMNMIHNADGTTDTRGEMQIGLQTQLVSIPGYGQAGHVSRVLTDGSFSRIMAQATMGQQGMLDFMFAAKAALAGYYKQSIERGDNGNLKGYSFFIGAGSGFEYALHDNNSPHQDSLAVVNVIGPTMEMSYYNKGLLVKATIDIYADFAMVRSYAIDKYHSGHTDEGIKTILAEQRYYYAMGVSFDPQLQASYHGFEAGASFKFDFFDSIEGHDRFQSRVTNDFNVQDHRLSYKLWLAYTLPNDHLKLAFSVEHLNRGGAIGDIDQERDETRYMGSMTVLF